MAKDEASQQKLMAINLRGPCVKLQSSQNALAGPTDCDIPDALSDQSAVATLLPG